ncbi:hypothetical protein [Alloscardovia omnicolens]|uniref:hypothetical protein n=1 Tax=Alloscardovia omnicolens TaxID=419015 RepID=UPI003A79ED4D
MFNKRIATCILTVFCALLTLLGIIGVSWAGFDIIQTEFSQFPEYEWIHTPILCLFALIPIPILVWVIYTAWCFSFGYKHLNLTRLDMYLRVSFWLAIAQAVVGFALPFTVSTFLNEGNPPMLIAWVMLTAIPVFVACLFAQTRRILFNSDQ